MTRTQYLDVVKPKITLKVAPTDPRMLGGHAPPPVGSTVSTPEAHLGSPPRRPTRASGTRSSRE